MHGLARKATGARREKPEAPLILTLGRFQRRELACDYARQYQQHGQYRLLIREVTVVSGSMDYSLEDRDAHQEQKDTQRQADESTHRVAV